MCEDCPPSDSHRRGFCWALPADAQCIQAPLEDGQRIRALAVDSQHGWALPADSVSSVIAQEPKTGQSPRKMQSNPHP